MTARVALATILLLSPCTALAAEVAVGERVRATLLADDRVTGTLLSVRADTLKVGERAIPRRDLSHLERSLGLHSNAGRGAGKGALIGSGAGVLAGILLGGEHGEPLDRGVLSLLLGTAGGLGGATIGLIIGSGSKSERWEPVPYPGE